MFINTPLTSDSAGNVFFGFSVLNIAPGGPSGGGVARIAPNGTAIFVQAADVTGVPTLVKTATNCAPALSADGSTLYVVFNNVPPVNTRPSGRLVRAGCRHAGAEGSGGAHRPGHRQRRQGSATTPRRRPWWDPNGDVFIGVLESNAPGHNYRGWLLHFNAALTQARTPGSFGWDNTPSVVPRAMVPQYTGSSGYLLLTKYNNYAGAGTGDGKNRMAILDPNDLTQADPIAPGVTVMREILTILGPTPDAGGAGRQRARVVRQHRGGRSVHELGADEQRRRRDVPLAPAEQHVQRADHAERRLVPVVHAHHHRARRAHLRDQQRHPALDRAVTALRLRAFAQGTSARKANAAKITRCTAPCIMCVRP